MGDEELVSSAASELLCHQHAPHALGVACASISSQSLRIVQQWCEELQLSLPARAPLPNGRGWPNAAFPPLMKLAECSALGEACSVELSLPTQDLADAEDAACILRVFQSLGFSVLPLLRPDERKDLVSLQLRCKGHTAYMQTEYYATGRVAIYRDHTRRQKAVEDSMPRFYGPPRRNPASRSLRRALLMPQVNTGSLYRRGKRT